MNENIPADLHNEIHFHGILNYKHNPINILWHFTRCMIGSEGSRGLNFEWKSHKTEIQTKNSCEK